MPLGWGFRLRFIIFNWKLLHGFLRHTDFNGQTYYLTEYICIDRRINLHIEQEKQVFYIEIVVLFLLSAQIVTSV